MLKKLKAHVQNRNLFKAFDLFELKYGPETEMFIRTVNCSKNGIITVTEHGTGNIMQFTSSLFGIKPKNNKN